MAKYTFAITGSGNTKCDEIFVFHNDPLRSPVLRYSPGTITVNSGNTSKSAALKV
jgi:hypothetical protein